MRELRSQLRSYVEETIERLDVDDVLASAQDGSLADEGRPGRRAAAFALGVVLVLIVVGGVAWLARGANPGPAVGPTGVTPTTSPSEVDGNGLQWHSVVGAADLESVSALAASCCWNVALDTDTWVRGFGESFTGPSSETIPSEFGPLRAIAASGDEAVAVPDREPSPTPYVAVQQVTETGWSPAWTAVELPTDVPSPHPDVVMHYRIQSVALSDPSFVLYGWAVPELDWAAIEREYPELAPVVGTDLVPPCCEGEPLTAEIEDPLWVWTGELGSEPTPVSLGTLGLTAGDLRGATGVVWVIRRLSAPAPWEPATALIIDDVGFEDAVLDGGPGGYVLVAPRATGEIGTWTSASGQTWSQAADLSSAVDATMWDGHALVLTVEGSVLELQGDTWVALADAGTFDSPNGEPADPVRIEAGDIGVVVVSDREEVLPWSDGEPIPTAQVMWFSSDGSAWSSQELSDIFGDVGAVQLLVTRYAGYREEPPIVLVAFGGGQADGGRIVAPEWWVAGTD